MFNPAQQGFGRYASNIGFKALGAAPGLNYEAAAELGSAALAAKAKIKAAKYQADATRYQGRQARNAAIFGGAMDLVASAKNIIVAMMHTNKFGESKLLRDCSLPLTGVKCVKKIVTNMAVIEVTSSGFKLLERAPGVDIETIRSSTQGKLIVDGFVPEMVL